jgi:hypothetical protein
VPTDALTKFFRPWYHRKITIKKSLDFSKRKAYNKYMKKAMTVIERETVMTYGDRTQPAHAFRRQWRDDIV